MKISNYHTIEYAQSISCKATDISTPPLSASNSSTLYALTVWVSILLGPTGLRLLLYSNCDSIIFDSVTVKILLENTLEIRGSLYCAFRPQVCRNANTVWNLVILNSRALEERSLNIFTVNRRWITSKTLATHTLTRPRKKTIIPWTTG